MPYSVAIPAFQAEDSIGVAVRSARGQTLPPVEVIVVDDGSTDRTREHAIAAGATVISQPNQGASVARNTALRVARADRVAFLDADDRWLPSHLAAIDLAFDSVPGAVLAFSGITKEFDWGPFEIPIPLEPYVPLSMLGVLLRRNQVPTSGAVVDRTAALSVGGFDSAYRIAQDYHLWLRLARLGPFVKASASTVRYRVGDGQLSSDYLRLLEEAWRARREVFSALPERDRTTHGADFITALEFDLRRSWNRRKPNEIDYLLSIAAESAGTSRLRRDWALRRRAFPLLRLPLMIYDLLPRATRTTLARWRGTYEYDVVH